MFSRWSGMLSNTEVVERQGQIGEECRLYVNGITKRDGVARI